MTPEEFEAALKKLEWRSATFCQKAGVERSTPSRWLNGKTEIPAWVPAFLGAMLDIKRLHAKYIEVRGPTENVTDNIGAGHGDE
jgi:hypothetical protein